MKRFLSILLAVAMTISMVLPVFAYTDTAENDYEAAIAHLSGLEVINGYEDGSFKPEKVVTRAEMAKLLVVALDLDAGAELLKGESQFSDVPTTHWAIGFVNVASQYGLIKGDGDGTFRPDDTVNYAEAATMALRALGYSKVVEKNGQWPTNYLNKASELKLFEDVESFKASEGAKRGEVAQILWNMLNTSMWEIVSESEGTGMTSTANRTMMDVKFTDYVFDDSLVFDSTDIQIKDGKFEVSLVFDDEIEGTEQDNAKYFENDFYKFVPGTEFEAVLKETKKGLEIVTLFVTEDNYLAEGNRYDLDEKYDNYSAVSGTTYEYIRLDSSKKAANILDSVAIKGGMSGVITEIKNTNNSKKIYLDDSLIVTLNKDDVAAEKGLIIKNGERVTVEALEEGDIVTAVAPSIAPGVMLVTDTAITGTYDNIDYVEKLDKYEFNIEISGKEYDARTGGDIDFYIYELDKDGERVELTSAQYNEFYNAKEKDNDYLGQKATFYFNAVGDLFKVVFDRIENTAKTGSFYVVTSDKDIWNDGENGNTCVRLANAEGIKKYIVDEDVTSAEIDLLDNAGTVLYVGFDKDNEIESVIEVTTGIYLPDSTDTEYVTVAATGDFDKDTKYIGNKKVTDNTVVYTITEKLDEDDNPIPGKYELEVTTGAKELDGVEQADIVAIAYDVDSVDKAAYVFVEGDAKSTDKNYGIVEESRNSKGIDYVTISGKEYELDSAVSSFDIGDAVIFTIDDNEASIKFVYEKDEIYDAATVVKVEDSIVTIDIDGVGEEEYTAKLDLDLLADKKVAVTEGPAELKVNFGDEEYKVFELEVDLDKNDHVYFAGMKEIGLDEVKVSKHEGIAINKAQKVIVIIKGFDYDDVTF